MGAVAKAAGPASAELVIHLRFNNSVCLPPLLYSPSLSSDELLVISNASILRFRFIIISVRQLNFHAHLIFANWLEQFSRNYTLLHFYYDNLLRRRLV